jgi:hypothetical protein
VVVGLSLCIRASGSWSLGACQSGDGLNESGPRQRRSCTLGVAVNVDTMFVRDDCRVLQHCTLLAGRNGPSHCIRDYLVAVGHVYARFMGPRCGDEANSQTGESLSQLCRNGAASTHMIVASKGRLRVEGAALARGLWRP